MSIADELKKLDGLRWNGTLTEAEFAQAKAALLAQLAPPPLPPPGPPAAAAEAPRERPADARYRAELERIDRAWEEERGQFMVSDKDGGRHVPSVGEGLTAAVVIGVFGVGWTVMALAITGGAPSFGPFAVAKVLFPLLGVGFTGLGVWTGLQAAKKAETYKRAHAAYLRRRAAVDPADFR